MNAKHLGEQVQQDRMRLGLTQKQLTSKLQDAPDKPINPYTKRPEEFTRSWLAKFEVDRPVRELSREFRHFLADALGADKTLYESLPLKQKPHGDSLAAQTECSNITKLKKQDVLPVVKKIAQMEGLNSLNFEQFTALCEAHFSLREVGVEFSTILAT